MKKTVLVVLMLAVSTLAYAQLDALGLTDDSKVSIKDQRGEEPFFPAIKILRWEDEESLSVKYNKEGFSRYVVDGNKVRSTKGDETIEFYSEGDNFKFLVYIAKKPATNKLYYKLDGWESFDFFYQPPFKNVNPDGSTWQDDGMGISTRPADVNGSYAVYHKTKRDHVMGKTNYSTGKFCHIYRPRFWDADGKNVWADLEIVDGDYTVTIPQKFLNTAEYPIKSNDTFGHTGIGATELSVGGDYQCVFGPHTSTATSTVASVSVYMDDTSQEEVTLGIWDDDGASGIPSTLLADTGGSTVGASFAWITLDLDSPLSVTNGLDYHFGFNHDAENSLIKYDAGQAGYDGWYDADTYVDGTLQNFVLSGGWEDGRKESIYVTYSATSGMIMSTTIMDL